jgi:RNA polymerase sigma-70 factor (ECF subfamily)
MWITGKQNIQDQPDEHLLKMFRETGDRKALGALFERYSHLVFGVCMKYLKNHDDSKDATIQIFEKLMVDLRRFEVKKFSYWVHSVARNYCLMTLRSRKAMHHIDDENSPGIDVLMENTDESHLYEALERENRLNLLEEAISALNDEQRACIELFYLKKMCYQDVSELTGYDIKKVKSHIQNGKRNLKIYMENKQHETTDT